MKVNDYLKNLVNKVKNKRRKKSQNQVVNDRNDSRVNVNAWYDGFKKKTCDYLQNNGFSQRDAEAWTNELCYNVMLYLSYLSECGYVDQSGYDKAVQKVMSQLDHIEFLPRGDGRYGEYVDGVVKININLPKEKRRLYMFHELAHISTGIREILNDAHNYPINGKYQHSHVYGYQVLDEAMVQDMAETMLYHSLGRQRPAIQGKPEPVLGINVPTNFDFYGIYQPIAEQFAQSLRGINNIHDMSKCAVSGNLYKHIIDEYRSDNVEPFLDDTLSKMGHVFQAKLRSFGSGADKDYIYTSGRPGYVTNNFTTNMTTLRQYYLDVINTLERLRDSR